MNIVDKIKQARLNNLSEEHKERLLKELEKRLEYQEYVVIGCGSHFQNPKWEFEPGLECPYSDKAAVTDFLRKEGFHVRDYINSFGVNYGIEVSI